MPLRIAKGAVTATFAYGPEHQRTRQSRSDGGMVVYAGAQEVEMQGGQATVKTYWPNGVGVEIDRPGAPTEMSWTHVDRLGSWVALTDEGGMIRERRAYDAWGKRRALGTAATPDTLDGQVENRGFTGHEMLDQFDLVHMNGRVYDPLVGRFLSVDALVEDPDNGQAYNRYSYVLNNPTNRTDPTGFSSCKDSGNGQDCEEVPKVEVKGEKETTKSGKDISTFSDRRTMGSAGGMLVITQVGSFGNAANRQANAKLGGASFNGLAVCGQCGRFKGNPSAKEIAGAASTVLDFWPGVSNLKSAGQIFAGKDLVTDEPVHRGVESVGFVAGVFPGGKIGAKFALSKLVPHLAAPIMHDHHLMPRQFKKFFEQRGINIDEHTVSLGQKSHLAGLHGNGLGNMPGGWNQEWSAWIEKNPDATAQEIYQQLGLMMDKFNINHLPIHPYDK